MRVLDLGLAREFAGHEDRAPKDLQSQPLIAMMNLMGETIPLHRFSNFVPTPQTEGDISQLPFLSGQGVGLVRELRPAREILHEVIEETAAVLSNLMARTRD
jgi:enoyl-[acyl-carrier protein] reductase II